MTFAKAYEAERTSWHWAALGRNTEVTVMAFCASVALRMKGSSMDELIAQCTNQPAAELDRQEGKG